MTLSGVWLCSDLTTTLEALDTTAKWTATEADRRALVEINLTETEIFWLVDIAGDTASSEGEDADIVRSSNETYMEAGFQQDFYLPWSICIRKL